MTVVHLVYPYGNSIATPYTISRHVADALRRSGYTVHQYQWDEKRTIPADPDEILLGHPHTEPMTIFRQSARSGRWRRVIAMAPFNTDLKQVAYLDPVLSSCDSFLAITGNYWMHNFVQSAVAHWKPKLIHLDLAVDRQDFPISKQNFRPPGQRKFLYIGHAGWYKNLPYLGQIARLLPEIEFAWIGRGKPVRGLKRLGSFDFAEESARALVGQYDFMITVGKADANPTTILEAMAWGLLPICTAQSGYVDYPSIVNLPLSQSHEAVRILRELEEVAEELLFARQKENWRLLDQHFNWNRFCQQVIAAIESNDTPALLPISPWHQYRLRLAASLSPNAPLGPRNLARQVYRVLRQMAGRKQGH
ncbi:MAG: glycosyltransferase [Chloroflexi bacterium]|nr:glycosyltransferase [Chloroflexota bacterium]